MNTTQIGNISEIACAKRYMELGYNILFPFGGSERYDFVIEVGNRFKRVQVKTGRLKAGAITATIKSPAKGSSYKGDIDVFAIYCPETKLTYSINYDEVPDVSSVTLRTDNPKVKRKDTKYATLYRL